MVILDKSHSKIKKRKERKERKKAVKNRTFNFFCLLRMNNLIIHLISFTSLIFSASIFMYFILKWTYSGRNSFYYMTDLLYIWSIFAYKYVCNFNFILFASPYIYLFLWSFFIQSFEFHCLPPMQSISLYPYISSAFFNFTIMPHALPKPSRPNEAHQ